MTKYDPVCEVTPAIQQIVGHELGLVFFYYNKYLGWADLCPNNFLVFSLLLIKLRELRCSGEDGGASAGTTVNCSLATRNAFKNQPRCPP